MSELRVRKRGRMREKDIKALSEQLSAELGVQVFTTKDTVDMAESSEFNVIFVNNEILGLMIGNRPFLTVRGILKYVPKKRYVTVDMGAVPFVTKGADVMGPGIIDVDIAIQPGEYVWVRDVKFNKALAIGEALITGGEMAAKKPGKAIKSMAYVGDKLWKYGEE
ncbi:MAG TPA: PUA domain-containing protein [Methanomassiliicoccales archaeon]|nr:PUA domain-containing protein [Methanomassiliicoccales archaeon]